VWSRTRVRVSLGYVNQDHTHHAYITYVSRTHHVHAGIGMDGIVVGKNLGISVGYRIVSL